MKKNQNSIEITKADIKALDELVISISGWAKKNFDTSKKLGISKKITGFIGEAIFFSQLKKHFKIKATWKGGVTGKYDILIEGSKKITINVKTTFSALRQKGKGANKKPDHYEWSNNLPSTKLNDLNLFFAFVDLKNLEKQPDIFIIPSRVTYRFYKTHKTSSWPRYHPRIKEIQRYKNKWPTCWAK